MLLTTTTTVNFISKAGLGSSDKPEQIIIALEPEAAAIFCLEKKMDAFQSETGIASVYGVLAQPNSHYMVVDIGGTNKKEYMCVNICLCDFAQRCPLSFRLNTGIASVAGKKKRGLGVLIHFQWRAQDQTYSCRWLAGLFCVKLRLEFQVRKQCKVNDFFLWASPAKSML